jgi:hypothetical protein
MKISPNETITVSLFLVILRRICVRERTNLIGLKALPLTLFQKFVESLTKGCGMDSIGAQIPVNAPSAQSAASR